jgi:hypothetical protein
MEMHTVFQDYASPFSILINQYLLTYETKSTELQQRMMENGIGRSETSRVKTGQGNSAIKRRRTYRRQAERDPVWESSSGQTHPESGPDFQHSVRSHN